MFASLLILLILPLTDLSRVRGNKFRPFSKFSTWVFFAFFVVLLWIGAQHPEDPFVQIGQIATAGYFGYFFLIVPIASMAENTLIDIAILSRLHKGSGPKGLFLSLFKRSFAHLYTKSYHTSVSRRDADADPDITTNTDKIEPSLTNGTGGFKYKEDNLLFAQSSVYQIEEKIGLNKITSPSNVPGLNLIKDLASGFRHGHRSLGTGVIINCKILWYLAIKMWNLLKNNKLLMFVIFFRLGAVIIHYENVDNESLILVGTNVSSFEEFVGPSVNNLNYSTIRVEGASTPVIMPSNAFSMPTVPSEEHLAEAVNRETNSSSNPVSNPSSNIAVQEVKMHD